VWGAPTSGCATTAATSARRCGRGVERPLAPPAAGERGGRRGSSGGRPECGHLGLVDAVRGRRRRQEDEVRVPGSLPRPAPHARPCVASRAGRSATRGAPWPPGGHRRPLPSQAHEWTARRLDLRHPRPPARRCAIESTRGRRPRDRRRRRLRGRHRPPRPRRRQHLRFSSAVYVRDFRDLIDDLCAPTTGRTSVSGLRVSGAGSGCGKGSHPLGARPPSHRRRTPQSRPGQSNHSTRALPRTAG